ncbi:MAG: YARHG domain-containing protein, partial [Butyrivibrio sp.]|nr:YARHG domain-containing protein [Butyrivibrio sp.]
TPPINNAQAEPVIKQPKAHRPEGGAFVSPALIALIAAGGLAILAAAIALVVVLSKPTINLNKYLTVEAEGIDGYGKASFHIDWDAIEKKYGDKLKFTSAAKKERSEDLRYMRPMDVFEEYISVSLDPTENLTNGDQVNYTWKVDDDLTKYIKCRVKYKDAAYTITELGEVGKFDVFADVSLIYEGIAPNGYAQLSYNGSEFSYYDFNMDKYSELSNGDKIKVTLDDSVVERCARDYGKVPETLEKEYTVTGLMGYITELSQVDDESLSAMKDQAEDAYYAHAAKSFGEGEEVKDLTYLGNILLTRKDNGQDYLYLVYRAKVHNFAENRKESYDAVNDVYWYIQYSDLMVDDSGNVSVDVTNYYTPGNTFTINSGISAWYSSWYYHGYETYADLYKDVVTKNLDNYNHEEAVDESVAGESADALPESDPGEDSEYMIPDSDKRLITKDELEGFTAFGCKIARNEIYARHGRKFNDEELKQYFEMRDWYHGTIEPDDFSEDLLSDIEIKNKDTIVEYEKEQGFR